CISRGGRRGGDLDERVLDLQGVSTGVHSYWLPDWFPLPLDSVAAASEIYSPNTKPKRLVSPDL
ncbi:MAG: hypothetical protein U9N79_01085, partial [Actinomycetota bacterium]|nr:hypothetical protein [Actinomycetota bacterium]